MYESSVLQMLLFYIYMLLLTFLAPFLARLNEVKECLCDTPDPRELALACDQNVQFLQSGQFLSTIRDRGFILGIHLYLGKINRTSEQYLTYLHLVKNHQFLCLG